MPEPIHIPPPGIPLPEVEINLELVRALIESQHPDLADRELRLFGSGWDNTTFRLGDDLAVRLPRRKLGAEMILKEQLWLAELASGLPLPVGEPVRVGEPEHGYPWTWSIVRWIDGLSAEQVDPDPQEAVTVGEFLGALHKPAPEGAPINPWRGGPLIERAPSVEQRLDRLNAALLGVDPGVVRSTWNRTKEVAIDVSPTWLHGDVHPRNVIVRDRAVVAIIDWGDLCIGDRATDLAAAWMLFPSEVHADFSAAYGPISDDTWERARAWAIFFGVIMVDAGSTDDPAWAARGRETLRRACA